MKNLFEMNKSLKDKLYQVFNTLGDKEKFVLKKIEPLKIVNVNSFHIDGIP